MKIKTNDWKLTMIITTFSVQRPKSLCSFSQLFVLALLMSPLIYPAYIYRAFVKGTHKDEVGGFVGFLVFIFGWGMSMYFFDKLKFLGITPPGEQMLLSYAGSLVGVLIIYIGLAVLIGIIFGCAWCHESVSLYIDKRRYKRSYLQKQDKKPNVLIEYIKAVKQKYCPKIEYVEPEQSK